MVKVSGSGEDSKGILQPVPKVPQVSCGNTGAQGALQVERNRAVVVAWLGQLSVGLAHSGISRLVLR